MAEATKVNQATDYVVLERREFPADNGATIVAWVEVGSARGTTRMGVATEVADGKDGLWRPVPARNWADPIETYTETEPKHKARVVKD